jgi:uncharacterized membrane protein YgdD (TMEM256/DUF423 family)
MTARWRVLLGLAALAGLAAVAAGASGQHGAASPAARDLLKTSADYGLAHALAIYAAYGLWRDGARLAEAAGWLFLAGLVAFCGSLDAMAEGASGAIAVLTPLGGSLMLGGWLALAIAAFLGVRQRG